MLLFAANFPGEQGMHSFVLDMYVPSGHDVPDRRMMPLPDAVFGCLHVW